MKTRLIPLGLALLFLAACAGTSTWQGADAEKTYDKNLEATRATAVLNNDDYYEIHKDGRIYVLADVADVKGFESSGEIPFRVTRIGGGPNGETIVFGIAKPESKKKEGFGSVEMYDGRRKGADRGFYAEVSKDDKVYVFGNWADLDAFRKSGQLASLSPADDKGPNGEAVMVAQPSAELLAKFREIHAR